MASEGRKVICRWMRTDVEWLDVCPALETGHTKLFLVLTFIMGKVPHLISLRERFMSLWSSQGLNCLQLKIIHMPKQHILGRPALNAFRLLLASCSLGSFFQQPTHHSLQPISSHHCHGTQHLITCRGCFLLVYGLGCLAGVPKGQCQVSFTSDSPVPHTEPGTEHSL